MSHLGGWECPQTCVSPHATYTNVVGCVVGSNVEALDVPGYTHAHALTVLRYAWSRLWFPWMSHLAGWECPKTCACPHVVYTRVVGCVVGSNVEPPDVSSYTHALALTTLRHACSRLWFIWMSQLGGWECPQICVYPHVAYTSVVGCVVGSNVEAPGVSGYKHAHALTVLRHACSRLWFPWMSHLAGRKCPKTCACPHVVYTSVVGCVVGSNVEPPGCVQLHACTCTDGA
jgi:hypothetical protein